MKCSHSRHKRYPCGPQLQSQSQVSVLYEPLIGCLSRASHTQELLLP